MTIGFGELRKGLAIDLDGQPFIVVDYERNKMQQRAPVMRIRFRDLKSGRMTERTFSGYDVSFKIAQVERRTADYIYKEDDLYYFMDTTSYEQFPLNEEQIGDALQYLIEQTTVDLVLFEENPVAIEMPTTVDLDIVETPPAFKGDTAQGGTKPATLETGLVITVPMFIATGEKVRVDTRTGGYLSRV